MTMERPSEAEAEASSNGNAPREFWFDGVGIPVFAVDMLGNVNAWNQKAGECIFKARGGAFVFVLYRCRSPAGLDELNGLGTKGGTNL
jgi:hypothetical protein